eukprot:610302_1
MICRQVSHHSLYIFYFIWIRSCYAPQLIPWIHYITSKYKHSIKIIQSEQYFSHDTFHDTMSKLLCYIHYNIDDDNYESWIDGIMDECVDKDRYNAIELKELKANSKIKKFHFHPTKTQIALSSNSFIACV